MRDSHNQTLSLNVTDSVNTCACPTSTHTSTACRFLFCCCLWCFGFSIICTRLDKEVRFRTNEIRISFAYHQTLTEYQFHNQYRCRETPCIHFNSNFTYRFININHLFYPFVIMYVSYLIILFPRCI